MQHNRASTQQLDPDFDFLSKSKLHLSHGDRQIRIHVSRNTLFAIIFSLLLHAVIFFFVPQIQFDTPPAIPARAIEVSLAQPQVPTQVVEPVQEERERVEKPVEPVRKPTVKTAPQKIMTAKPLDTAKPSFKVPEAVVNKAPELDTRVTKTPVIKEPAVEEQFTDMASYVKARQAKRLEAEAAAADINAEAAARERGPTEAQLSDERIKRNLKYGTNGIFEITSLGPRNATFAFRGWTNDYSTSQRQFFEVEAASGQDVRLVMIRRMIALIREHYQGNFNWESHRLGRTVVQSARLEDNAGLEDFLMMEFFGSNYRSTQQ